jgi:CubicO group peptidase (beta-lactamase class C family)
MLTHVSGLPDYESAMTGKWNPDKVAFNADMIAFLANEKPPVYFAPGAKWLYSNTAYAILASIVEKVSGQTFAAFLAKTFLNH